MFHGWYVQWYVLLWVLTPTSPVPQSLSNLVYLQWGSLVYYSPPCIFMHWLLPRGGLVPEEKKKYDAYCTLFVLGVVAPTLFFCDVLSFDLRPLGGLSLCYRCPGVPCEGQIGCLFVMAADGASSTSVEAWCVETRSV